MSLSGRETQCLELLIEGKHDKDIARVLGVAPETVRTYVRLACAKLDAPNRLVAAVKFDRQKRF